MPIHSKRRTRPALFLIPTLSLLASCGGGSGYPSLARRPAELLGAGGETLPRCPHATAACAPGSGTSDGEAPARVSGSAAVAEPEAAPAPDRGGLDQGSLRDRLAALSAQARATHATFMAKRPAVEAAAGAAASASPGSDGWAAATTMLSELQSAHGTNLATLADIDTIAALDRVEHAADDATEARSRADAEAIRAAADSTSSLVDEEARIIDSIRTKLRQ